MRHRYGDVLRALIFHALLFRFDAADPDLLPLRLRRARYAAL